LDGIRIVEYGVFHAGTGGNAILGVLGADMIKIASKELGCSNLDVENLRNEGIIG
jgi:crotonobetainyl-CoA:carnitine CoA-transferase CaiB-like acyl-CoA transferase